MSLISLIAAIDETGGLGINNQLLCYLPADLQHFKSITMGKPIIMGRKTYESIGKPLPGRLNIVISQSIQSIPGVVVVDSLGQAIKETADASEVMIIGGSRFILKPYQWLIAYISLEYTINLRPMYFFQKSMNWYGAAETRSIDSMMTKINTI